MDPFERRDPPFPSKQGPEPGGAASASGTKDRRWRLTPRATSVPRMKVWRRRITGCPETIGRGKAVGHASILRGRGAIGGNRGENANVATRMPHSLKSKTLRISQDSLTLPQVLYCHTLHPYDFQRLRETIQVVHKGNDLLPRKRYHVSSILCAKKDLEGCAKALGL